MSYFVKLPFVLILIGCAALLTGASKTPGTQPKQNTKTENPAEKGNAEANPSMPGFIQISSPPTTAHSEYNIQNYYYSPQGSWDWAGIIQAGATIGLLIFAGWQMRFVRRTTEASERASRAAEESARAAADNVLATRELAYLERPWLIVKPGDPNWPFTQTVSTAPPFVVTIGWSATNEGRSPAFLTNLSVSFVCAPFPIPDEQPPYDIFKDFAEMPVPPKGAHGSERLLQITDSDLAGIKAQKLCLKFYGFLEYFDLSRREVHKTRFCAYWYMQNSSFPWMLTYVPVGPRSYIDYT